MPRLLAAAAAHITSASTAVIRNLHESTAHTVQRSSSRGATLVLASETLPAHTRRCPRPRMRLAIARRVPVPAVLLLRGKTVRGALGRDGIRELASTAASTRSRTGSGA